MSDQSHGSTFPVSIMRKSEDSQYSTDANGQFPQRSPIDNDIELLRQERRLLDVQSPMILDNIQTEEIAQSQPSDEPDVELTLALRHRMTSTTQRRSFYGRSLR